MSFFVQENSVGETNVHTEVRKAYCSVLWDGLSWKNILLEFCESVKKKILHLHAYPRNESHAGLLH